MVIISYVMFLNPYKTKIKKNRTLRAMPSAATQGKEQFKKYSKKCL